MKGIVSEFAFFSPNKNSLGTEIENLRLLAQKIKYFSSIKSLSLYLENNELGTNYY